MAELAQACVEPLVLRLIIDRHKVTAERDGLLFRSGPGVGLQQVIQVRYEGQRLGGMSPPATTFVLGPAKLWRSVIRSFATSGGDCGAVDRGWGPPRSPGMGARTG